MHALVDDQSDLLVGPDQAPLLARPYYADGDPGPTVAALAQVPELLETAMPFLSAALGPSGIDWRTKEIVIVRTSALAGCRYCVQTHTVVALDAGLNHGEVRALRTDIAGADAFSDPPRAGPARLGGHRRGNRAGRRQRAGGRAWPLGRPRGRGADRAGRHYAAAQPLRHRARGAHRARHDVPARHGRALMTTAAPHPAGRRQ